MKWQELRKMYPEQFVKVEILEAHVENGKEHVDEVALVKTLADGKEATKELLRCKDNQVIYNTKNEEFIIELVKNVGVRRGI